MKIVEKKKLWFSISGLIILIGIGFFIYRGGLNLGIDFKGGTEVIIQIDKSFKKEDVDQLIKKHAPNAVTNTVNNNQIQIRDKAEELNSAKVKDIMTDVKDKYKVDDKALVSQNEIGASVGKELTKNALIALTLAILGMLVYVAVRFKWDFGIAAIIALLHDVLITLSMYTIFNISVNSSFIAAILTIIGYSMNDTVVIFDRIRENLKSKRGSSPAEVANISIAATMSRSINTSLTTLIAIASVYVLVPSIRDFTFPLMVGIFSGAFSSIFIASPIWVMLKEWEAKKNNK
ncbi:MAG: protein translocase subunit SecF [Inconstantimicrobium porci]|uniref:protein translocase subunit SecF n=1 Tax=Inconstantimicrobium porci TaxID=2652291 RepID=UPI002409E571|nr:protein translocase subunit SecF [Inconstantimicrobium porci]MDD6770205.1 protein translocase subunit SecF [Inconstantimicrobium porci]MDY5912519.1 protein translocase subunit SecF [Inconstantimicrobium porci]